MAVSRPEVHDKVHQSDNSAIEVLCLVGLMKEEVARDPSVPLSKKYLKYVVRFHQSEHSIPTHDDQSECNLLLTQYV